MFKSFRRLVEEIKLVEQVKVSLHSSAARDLYFRIILFGYVPVALAGIVLLIVILFVEFSVFPVSWGVTRELISFSFFVFNFFLVFLVLIHLLYCLLSGAFHCIWCLLDFAYRPCLRRAGTIISKEIDPAFTLHSNVCTVAQYSVEIPSHFYLLIKTPSGNGRYLARQNFYNKVSVGNGVFLAIGQKTTLSLESL